MPKQLTKRAIELTFQLENLRKIKKIWSDGHINKLRPEVFTVK